MKTGRNQTNAAHNAPVEGLKDGILLEVGFDDVTPNVPTDISSWAYDYAAAFANEQGGHDNISAALLQLSGAAS